AGQRQGVGLAFGPRFRDSRRREGHGTAGFAPPPAAASRGGTRGRDGRIRPGQRARDSPHATLMVTVRAAALLGAATIAGAIPVVAGVDPWLVALAAFGAVMLFVLVDLSLVARP